MDPRIIVINTLLLGGQGLQEQPPWPAADRTGIERHWNAEAHVGEVAIGVYAAEPGSLRIAQPYPVDEVVQVLSGDLILTPTGASAQHFQPGDWVYVPKGYTGTWEMRGAFREIHIISGDDAPGDLSKGLPTTPERSAQPVTGIASTMPAGSNPSSDCEPPGNAPTSAESPIIRSDLEVERRHFPESSAWRPSPWEQTLFVSRGGLMAAGTRYTCGSLLVIPANAGEEMLVEPGTELIIIRASDLRTRTTESR